MKWHHLAWSGCAACLRGLGTLLLWTLWLGLAVLLAVQIRIAATDQLELPNFVRNALEDRLAQSGMHAEFGRTLFDPSGRVLVEDVRLMLPGFDEPLVTAGAIYARLDPWALLVGRFEPVELRVTGVSLRVPAMLSPSGKSDEIVRDLDAVFAPRGDELRIDTLDFRLGDVVVFVHGAVHLAPSAGAKRTALPLAEFLARNYPGLSRQFAEALETLGALDHPVLLAELEPSESRGAIASVTLLADGLKLATPAALKTTGLRLTGRIPFSWADGAPADADLNFATDEMDLPAGAVVRGVRARLKVKLPAGRFKFDPSVFQGIETTATSFSGWGITVQQPIVRAEPGTAGQVHAALVARVFDSPMSVGADLDLKARTAGLHFDGALAPALLDPIGQRLGRDLRKFVDPSSPIVVAGDATFGAGWKFQRVAGRVEARNLVGWHVKLDEVRGTVEFDGRRLFAPEAHVRLGDDYASGTYEQDVVTRDYRINLSGALRPLDISAWFPTQPWWREFFGNFAFPAAPPFGSADVQGNWSNGRKARVFVAVDSAGAQIKGVTFDRLRTRVFIRPNFDDGLDFLVTRGAGSARGTFARRWDLDKAALQSVEFTAVSTLDPAEMGKMYPDKTGPVLAPFTFDRPPTLTLSGRIDGAAAPDGVHRVFHVDARSDGAFRYGGFPFERVAFSADVHDDAVAIDHVEAGFARGSFTGRAKISGEGAARRLSFDAALKGANLSQAVASVETFLAQREHKIPPALGSFIKEKNTVQFDVAASAEGLYANPLSYTGGGTASVRGAELGEVRMLGLLSELLPFTSLRFTSAKADFKLNGPQIAFSDVSVSGANSEIRGKGSYGIDRHQLDFNAKIYPFQKSKSFLQAFSGVVLAPLSQILEVKLTGTIEKPVWSLANSPVSLLRKVSRRLRPRRHLPPLSQPRPRLPPSVPTH